MVNMIDIIISAIAWVADVLVDGVISPILKARRLALLELRVDDCGVIDLDESILVSIYSHSSISFVEDVSSTLFAKLNWMMDLGSYFVI